MNAHAVEQLTFAAGIAGYVGGMVADEVAVRRAAHQQLPYSEAEQQAYEQAGLAVSATEKAGRRAGALLLSPLAAVVGVTAAINTYAWAPQAAGSEQAPSTLEVVIDRSGATNLSIGGKPAVTEINSIASQFTDLGRVQVEAILSGGGANTTTTIDKVAQNVPAGPADLPSATALALSRTNEQAPVRKNGSLEPNAGVLVITNGNTIGSAKAVLQQAGQRADQQTVKTPVFIVDVEGQDTKKAVSDSFKTIAAETGGRYWTADSKSLDTVAKDVRSTVVNTETTGSDAPDKTPVKWLGGTAALAAVLLFRKRGAVLFGRGVN